MSQQAGIGSKSSLAGVAGFSVAADFEVHEDKIDPIAATPSKPATASSGASVALGGLRSELLFLITTYILLIYTLPLIIDICIDD